MVGKALTIDEFKRAMPVGMQKSVNPLLVMQVNNILSSEEECEMFKENLLSYTHVLQTGKFKMSGYINAIKYVGFKNMNLTNKVAYEKTFPEKIAKWALQGVTSKTIASYVHAYNKSKLVMLIFEQSMIPVHILNQPAFQQALNVQIGIMLNPDASFKVQSDAANSVMTQVKPPETKRVELDIGMPANSIIDDYKKVMSLMVEKQLELIGAGGDVKAIANASIKPEDKQGVIDI